MDIKMVPDYPVTRELGHWPLLVLEVEVDTNNAVPASCKNM